MAAKRPLVIDAGQVRELQDTDTLVGAGGGGSATPTYVPSGETLTVAADTQMLMFLPCRFDGDLQVDGALIMLASVDEMAV